MTKKSAKRPVDLKPKHQLTERERVAVEKHVARAAAQALAPRMKVANGEKITISPDHPDEAIAMALLMEALGTADLDFADGLIRQVANAGSQGRQIDERGLNFLLAVIKGVKPRDQLEAMLAAQMATVHEAMMTFARRLAHVDNLPQQDSAERAFNKLARTYAMQMEALKRYRTGGEQKVTVQHVSVSEGGQAIVGNVTQAARDTPPEKPASLTPALTDARTPAMPIIDEPEREPVVMRRRKKDDRRSSA